MFKEVTKNALKTKRNILQFKRNIKRKLLALKLQKDDKDREFRETYDSIIQPINAIASHIAKTPEFSKRKIKIEKTKQEGEDKEMKQESEDDDEKTPQESEGEGEEENRESDSQDEESEDEDGVFKSASKLFADTKNNALLDVYVKKILTDPNSNDDKYGVVLKQELGEYTLGSEAIKFKDDKVILGDKTYKATPGLFELLFLKKPKRYTKEDCRYYNEMLRLSKAIFRNNNPLERLKGNRSVKYIKIIKPYQNKFITKKQSPNMTQTKRRSLSFPTRSFSSSAVIRDKMEGKGIKVDGAPRKFIYWNDPNELVERLVLLHGSQQAGNTSHAIQEEISRIEEELREEQIID